MNTRDNCIWKNFVEGDISALKLLMEQYFRFLFNYGTKITKDEELVKDTVQELFIKLWTNKENLSRDVNLKAYLITSLRRALYRKIQALDRFDNFTDHDNNLLHFEFEFSVEQKFITAEFNKLLALKLAKHLSSLPKRQKEVLYLKFMENLTREEIAVVMNISLQTVSNMCHIALKNLKAQLGDTNQSKNNFYSLIY
ncbi:MAG: transcriptional regulator, LuxR family [Mucilaginibacter sp.]|jgi:RNA polymerase sigma factor (sigma-70 family)|nr:transcriptional regulator, LuxR family [Mucilaginibacter sp.]